MVEATAKSAKPSYRMRLAESLNLPILRLNRLEKNRNGVGVYFHKQTKKRTVIILLLKLVTPFCLKKAGAAVDLKHCAARFRTGCTISTVPLRATLRKFFPHFFRTTTLLSRVGRTMSSPFFFFFVRLIFKESFRTIGKVSVLFHFSSLSAL